jgi:hypothetical protein
VSFLTEAGPKYPSERLRRTHVPEASTDYDVYRTCLREEFFFTCVYCLGTEAEVGPTSAYGGFEIEHFRPKGKSRFRHLRNRYGNLLWACAACNRAKRHKWPTDSELKRGYRFIDPTEEALGAHLDIVGERVVAVAENSHAAAYMIDEINLNSAVHRHRRRVRAELAKQLALVESLHSTITKSIEKEVDDAARAPLLERAELLRGEIEELARQVDRGRRPWDSPEQCFCR